MSATASKASRREIRRAVGPAAVDIINTQANNIQYLKSESDGLTSELAKLREVQEVFREQLLVGVPMNQARATAVLRRGFWGRLTWLVRGR